MLRFIVLLLVILSTVVQSILLVVNSLKMSGDAKFSAKTLPPPMTSNVPGTWAFDTMSRRIHEDILPRIISDNAELLGRPTSSHFAETFLQLNDLKSSIECGKTGYLRPICDGGPDVDTWAQLLDSVPEDERNWLDAPWFISEYYFYRRIIEAFNFFESRYDPFVEQKVNGLVESLKSIEDISSRISILFDKRVTEPSVAIQIAVQTSLWGNKMDLSLWPASKDSSGSGSVGEVSESGKISYGAALDAGSPFILDDYTPDIVSHLLSTPPGRIDIVVDNAGYELVSDFLLGYSLLKLGRASEVVFHTKGHPTFVSDATTGDCISTIDFLTTAADSTSGELFRNTIALAEELGQFVADGKFKFESDVYWCQPFAFWDRPKLIDERLKGSNLVFVKGDANYRRLLGERQWPMDTNAREVLSYWPVPVCALRTFKGEIG